MTCPLPYVAIQTLAAVPDLYTMVEASGRDDVETHLIAFNDVRVLGALLKGPYAFGSLVVLPQD